MYDCGINLLPQNWSKYLDRSLTTESTLTLSIKSGISQRAETTIHIDGVRDSPLRVMLIISEIDVFAVVRTIMRCHALIIYHFQGLHQMGPAYLA
jgi:hypothetical protein